jgi:hypothetical protein
MRAENNVAIRDSNRPPLLGRPWVSSVLGINGMREKRMYLHENPLKPRTDMGLWIGGALAIAIVLGIIFYGVTWTDETVISDRQAPISSSNANR